MTTGAISEVEFLETLDEEKMDFMLSFGSQPRVMTKFQNLFDCRIHLLVHETTYLLPGESKYVETNVNHTTLPKKNSTDYQI